MIVVRSTHSDNNKEWTCYRIAGSLVCSDQPIQQLHAFEAGCDQQQSDLLNQEVTMPDVFDVDSAYCRYQGNAPFENRQQRISCYQHDRLLQICVEDQPACLIDRDSKTIWVLLDRSLSEQLVLELVTGPALVLLLAEMGTYCLHASAIFSADIGTLFIAESGVGKSTLAGYEYSDWQQLADDIVPIEQQATGFVINHHFPQLKLPDCSVRFERQTSIDIRFVFRLMPDETDEISFHELPGREAMLELVRHTVAAKLFGDQLLKAHMHFATELAEQVCVYQLSYPRIIEQLPIVCDAVTAFILQHRHRTA